MVLPSLELSGEVNALRRLSMWNMHVIHVGSHNGCSIYKRTPATYFRIICYDNRPPQSLSMWVKVTTDVITLDTVIISAWSGNTEMICWVPSHSTTSDVISVPLHSNVMHTTSIHVWLGECFNWNKDFESNLIASTQKYCAKPQVYRTTCYAYYRPICYTHMYTSVCNLYYCSTEPCGWF